MLNNTHAEYWTIHITHCTSYFHHNLQHHRTITSDTTPMTDNCINTKDTWVTVILWQGYYTKIHTDSVTYVNANSSFFFFFIVQTLSFMHCTCNFICGLSDVIINTFSQSVSQLTCAFFAFVNSTFSSFFRCFLVIGLTWLSRITSQTTHVNQVAIRLSNKTSNKRIGRLIKLCLP